jgi:hypothetical protein
VRKSEIDQSGRALYNRRCARKHILLEGDPFSDVEPVRAGTVSLPRFSDQSLVKMKMTIDQTWNNELAL